MSALHRLKAYFGMVPAEELDEYGPDYRDDYRTDYGVAYDDVDEPYERPVRRAHFDGFDRSGYDRSTDRGGHDRGGHDDAEGYPEPVGAPVSRLRTTPRRPGWAGDTAVRGALAVDTAPPREVPVREPVSRNDPFDEDEGHPLARIVTLHPLNYNEARPIGERYREGMPVIMNLTGMDDADAKRLVDFAAGLAFALRGSIDKVTSKVFLLSPANVEVSAEDKRRIAEGGFFNQS